MSRAGAAPGAAAPRTAPHRQRGRAIAFMGALVVAAALHVLIVAGLDTDPPAFARRVDGRSAALSVRAVPTAAQPERIESVPAAPPDTATPPRRPRTAASALAPMAEAAPPEARMPRSGAESAPRNTAAPSVADTSTTDASGPLSLGTAPAQPIPIYATRIPPSATLSFRARRGTLQGEAQLRWHLLGERYQAQLQASVAGAPLFRQSSEGALDGAGLAPERFTDQRARRGTRAISFQRDSGRVSFSSVPGALDLSAGMQDRLSWIAQLAAVASANPDRLVAGGEIVLMLVGTRGEAVPWRFVSFGPVVREEANSAPSIHLQRLAASTYDTAVDVWLDPAPPHWPMRAHWRNGPVDPGLELWRVETDATR